MATIRILFPAEGETIVEREYRDINTENSSYPTFQAVLDELGITHNLVINTTLTKSIVNKDGSILEVYNRYSDKATPDGILEMYLSNKITFNYRNDQNEVFMPFLWGPNNMAGGKNVVIDTDPIFLEISDNAGTNIWRIDESDNEFDTSINGSDGTNIVSDMMLYALYTVTLNSNNEVYRIIKFDGTTETILPTDLVRDGYTFSGWYDNAEFTGSPIVYIEAMDYNNYTLYAKWDATETPDPDVPGDIPSGNSGPININSFLNSTLSKEGVVLLYNYGENSAERKLIENNTQIILHENYFKMNELNEVELNLKNEQYVSKFTPDGKVYCKEFREVEK